MWSCRALVKDYLQRDDKIISGSAVAYGVVVVHAVAYGVAVDIVWIFDWQ